MSDETLIFAIAVLITMLTGYGVFCHNRRAYNNGICQDCGGRMKFMHRRKHSYIYRCERCGQEIELEYRMEDYI